MCCTGVCKLLVGLLKTAREAPITYSSVSLEGRPIVVEEAIMVKLATMAVVIESKIEDLVSGGSRRKENEK